MMTIKRKVGGPETMARVPSLGVSYLRTLEFLVILSLTFKRPVKLLFLILPIMQTRKR